MANKYRLEPIKFNKKDAFRVFAVKDFGNVKAGDMGGIVFGPTCLSQEGLCWIDPDVIVKKHAHVCNDAFISGPIIIGGHSCVSGKAAIVCTRSSEIRGRSVIGAECIIHGGVTIKDSHIRETKVADCVIHDCKITGSSLNKSVVSDSTIVHTTLDDADVYNSSLNSAKVYMAELTDAVLNFCEIKNDDEENTIFPRHINISNDVVINSRTAVFVFYHPSLIVPSTLYKTTDGTVYLSRPCRASDIDILECNGDGDTFIERCREDLIIMAKVIFNSSRKRCQQERNEE